MKKSKSRIKAVGLLSGGLDSILAVKIMKEQGIRVIALNFTSPFCLCSHGCNIISVARRLGVRLVTKQKGKEYLNVIRNPKHGYGRALNPCIDCRIFILKKAKQFAKRIGAKFIFTGEVLNERPMSQHKNALDIIEKEAGLAGKILRPLSARLLLETEAEKKGWADRSKLLAISGRRRTPQISLAKHYNLDFPCPSGGCLLTYKEFAAKVKDLFKWKKNIAIKDIQVLKIGRHFRIDSAKFVVGRNEKENKQLEQFGKNILKPVSVPGPSILIQGKINGEMLLTASALLAYYADEHSGIKVKFRKKRFIANAISGEDLDKMRIKW